MDVSALTPGGLLSNLSAATLGNVLGGVCFLAAFYIFAFGTNVEKK
jgi:formate/nitrite transporter FocA (FNT family)